MNDNFYNRIEYKGPIENVLKKVCLDFGLGNFKAYELVPFGYEDFNVILNAEGGKFFVKIFASYRSDAECGQYVEIMQLVHENKINYPFLYKSSKGYYYVLELENTKLRLVVQEFIDGKNFMQLETIPTKKEKEFIIRQAAEINSLNFKPKPVYDSWAITNFAKEFEKRGEFLPGNLKEEIEKTFKEFAEVNIDSLPHCFVHGDIIRSNIMKDKNGKIWIIDFAVSNYYPRIIDLAALICFNLFNPDDPTSLKETYDFTLKNYQKFIQLNKTEIEVFPIFIKTSFAMYLMRASYEKIVSKNNSAENEHWLKVGTAGLQTKL